MTVDTAPPRDHFALFGLPVAFALDRAALDRAYRSVLSHVHPDRFAGGSEVERRLAMQWATEANLAYRTLSQPLDRARYLLHLHGVAVDEATSAGLPAEFLLQQMTWREALAEGDAAAARATGDAILAERARLLECLAVALDEPAARNLPAAAELVRKLRFLDRLTEELDLLAVAAR